MKILYVGLLYNYGKPDEGFSYEHMNIEAGLKQFCHTVCWYPDAQEQSALESLSSYDAIFHVAFNETLDLPEGVARFAMRQDIPVIQFDCDASWRFGNWIQPRKNRVSHFVTTHSATVPWYEQNGMKVIKSQWAGSPLYRPDRKLYQYDITFVGQKHGQMPNGKFVRADTINLMMAAGLNVDIFGNYWDGYKNWHGYTKDFQSIIDVFNTSRINLNISNPWHYGSMPQIKGRHFEIPQCNAFQLSTPADDLESYFIDGKEIVIARSEEDLVEKAKYYLENSMEREAISTAGYKRMMLDHQWSNRFNHIFKEVGIV